MNRKRKAYFWHALFIAHYEGQYGTKEELRFKRPVGPEKNRQMSINVAQK